MALPYTIVMTLVGWLCVQYLLPELTQWFIDMHLITLPDIKEILR
jgi:NhaB family Na+:H+ antiporter